MKFKFTKLLMFTAMMSCSLASNAALILQGGTGSSGAGNITLDSETLIDVGHSAYFNGSTSPASDWVWAENVSDNADLLFSFFFSLDGYDISTAELSGFWGVDNIGSVYLNGNLLSSLPDVVPGNFNVLTAFGAGPGSSSFLAGANLLTFEVGNRGGPGAFRASVEVTASPVPAPNVLSLMLIGFACLVIRKVTLSKAN